MESMSKGVGNEPSAAELCDSGYGFDNTEVSSGPHQTQGRVAPFLCYACRNGDAHPCYSPACRKKQNDAALDFPKQVRFHALVLEIKLKCGEARHQADELYVNWDLRRSCLCPNAPLFPFSHRSRPRIRPLCFSKLVH